MTLIFLLSIFATRAFAADLSQVVEASLSRSPLLAAARANNKQAEAGLREVQMARFPSFAAKGAVIRSDDPVFVFSSLLEQRGFGPQNFAINSLNNPGYWTNVKSSLELGLPLFSGFAITSREQISRMELRHAEFDADTAVQRIRAQAIDSWLGILFDTEILSALDERIVSAAGELSEARKLKERGLVLGSDFFAAEAILGGLEAWRTQLATDLAAKRSQLAVATGNFFDGVVSGGLSDAAYDVESSSELVRRALETRQDLRQEELAGSMARVLRRQASISFLPTIEAFGALETNTRDFSSSPSDRLFGIRASLPIGDPGYFPRRAKAAAMEEAATASKAALEDSIRADVDQSYIAYVGARRALAQLKETVDQSRRSLALFRPLYREGRQSVLEVLRAEEGLAKAEAAYKQALFGIHAGYARLRLSEGALDAKVTAEIESHLGGR